jgi:hypothetical protein
MPGANHPDRAATDGRQLPLPLFPTGPAPPPLPLTFVTLPSARVWHGLTPLLRTQVRQTALRILREVLDDQQP